MSGHPLRETGVATMRRSILLWPVALLSLASSGMVPAPADSSGLVYDPPAAGSFISDNVTYLGTVPIEAIGGKMITVGEQQRFYVTGAPGLVIYDVTNPALPIVIGGLPLPHFQNEDVDVSDDGSRVIISTDTANAGPDGKVGTGSVRVIDTSDPASPRILGHINHSNHTSMCADPSCEWLYGSSGRIYDARDPANIKESGRWRASGGGGHALNRDASGLVISDSSPRLVLDVSDPAQPAVVAEGSVAAEFRPDGLLQHNNVRPDADRWVARDPAAPDYDDPTLRPGELLIGNSESNVRTQCGSNAGGLSTWSMANFDQGQDIQQLEVFRPVNGTWADGDAAVNALGCSGHWFTVKDDMIAAAWYEHGIRFIEVDPATGTFTQKGFFQPVATEAGSAHWVTDAEGNEYVYTTDYARGIDILRFDREAPAPTESEIVASWLANLGRIGVAANAERMLCRIGAQTGA